MSIDLPSSGFQDLPEIAERTARTSVHGFLRFSDPAVRVLLPASLIIGCTVAWALAEGTNAGLAVLVGYSALASTIALVQSIPATKTRGFEPKAKSDADGETSVAWKLVSTFTISDASRLWCNIEPGTTATQESMAWGRALLDAVKQGNLPIVATGISAEAQDRERQNPHYMTKVTRAALKHWADQNGHTPKFLRE
jgi:hypothetical protein